MTIRSIIALSFIVLSLAACNSEETFQLKPLNLTQYGVPLTIMAPDSAVVKTSKIGDWDDITVKKEAYSIQILGKKSPSATTTAERLKNEELITVTSDTFFSKTLRDEAKGFVFENEMDSIKGYDFRYFHVLGDQIFTFQKGFTDNLTESQAKQIYESVKGE